MFRTSIVHLQEHSYAVCCNLVCLDTLWGWGKNCSSSLTLITTGRIETHRVATYSIWTLLKMDYWVPKHVELLNVMNKIIKYCVSRWITYILQNYTRTIQYQIHFSINVIIIIIIVIIIIDEDWINNCTCWNNWIKILGKIIISNVVHWSFSDWQRMHI